MSGYPTERENGIKFKHILISYSLIAVSLIVGLLAYAYTLLPTKEVAEETMRGGKSQLSPVDSVPAPYRQDSFLKRI
jgi:hypothetical protein